MSTEHILVRVVGRYVVAESVISVELEPVQGDLPSWSAGAHIDLYTSDDIRQYSIVGVNESGSAWRLGVLVEPDGRGGSLWISENLHVGAKLKIGKPRNHFEFNSSSDKSKVFIAGGIGITPLLPMIAEAEAKGLDWRLHYVGSSLSKMAFVDELNIHAEKVKIYARDTSPRPDLQAIVGEANSIDVYCCGPEGLMDTVEKMGQSNTSVTVNTERFLPKPLGDDTGYDEFEVYFEFSDITVKVGREQSILDAAEAVGIEVPTSCREGTCGSCETNIVEGEVIHLDSLLTENEREASETMMICISRAKCSRLVLDL